MRPSSTPRCRRSRPWKRSKPGAPWAASNCKAVNFERRRGWRAITQRGGRASAHVCAIIAGAGQGQRAAKATRLGSSGGVAIARQSDKMGEVMISRIVRRIVRSLSANRDLFCAASLPTETPTPNRHLCSYCTVIWWRLSSPTLVGERIISERRTNANRRGFLDIRGRRSKHFVSPRFRTLLQDSKLVARACESWHRWLSREQLPKVILVLSCSFCASVVMASSARSAAVQMSR